MDAYVKVLKSSNVQSVKRQSTVSAAGASTSRSTKLDQNRPPVDVKGKGKAIEISDDEDEDEIVEIPPPRTTSTTRPTSRVDAAKQTKHLLKTLKDVANPITHSSAGERYDYVSSCCTGHERRDESHPGGYHAARSRKLMEQEKAKGTGAEETSAVMKGVRAYFGFCDDNTDIELRRIISLAGGTSTYAQTSATHIITSQWLSGSKTNKLLTSRSKKTIHVVSPEWLTDSIAKGKRQSEWRYSKVDNGVQRRVVDGFLKTK